ncbi:MAG TPA: type II secretory pathway, component PulD, partial [Isosphaeraceae bacterium]|nr:type II secretory pathway, component PulD [Isosphaeraceae bacterium]
GPVAVPNVMQANPVGDPGPRLGTIDAKQQARWLLATAREQGKLGHYDEADQLVAKADSLGVKWGLFDDTPAKVRESIARARPKMAASSAAPGAPHNRRAAQAKIKEGRALLSAGQFEQAEAISLEVNSWNLAYGMLEDNPTKLGNAARALRRREQLRNSSPRGQASQVVYDAAVQQSRALLAAGRLDKAETKAREALRLNIVPSLTADRAESVLHDIAMAKQRKPQGGSLVAPPAAESVAARTEREANDLLARNQTQAAAAKFAEAERARAAEARAAEPKADPAVRQVDGTTGAPVPVQPPALVAVEPPPAEALPLPEPPAQAAATPPVPADPAVPAPAADRGAELLAEAKALFAQGKYPIAKKMAEDAKAAGTGSDAQADELIAAIALAEQGGALSVYETALGAIRKGETERARALLAEVQASGAGLDEGMRKKVDDLLDRLPKDSKSKGKAIAADSLNDAQALEAQRINAEVGAKVAESRRWLETDPEKAIAILNEGLAAVKAKDLPPTVARTMTRRLEVAIELAKKEKLVFDVKIKDKKVKEEIESKKLRILEADKAKKAQIVALMTQAQEAYANGKLAEAETLAKRAQEIDPNEVGPQMLVYKANIERHYTQSVDDKKAKEESFLEQMHAVDRAAVVDPLLNTRGITYTKDYKDLMGSRQALFANLEPRKDPSTLNIEKKLRETINVNMQNQTLEEAITYLQNYTGL